MTAKELAMARTKAKAVNFGLIYGMGLKGFIIYCKDEYNIQLTDKEGQDYIDTFFRTYPMLPVYHSNAINFCRASGYIESPFNRRRRLPEINSNIKGIAARAEKQAINFPVQAASSDSMLLAASELMRKGLLDPKLIKLILFVHDELVFEIKSKRDGSNVQDCATMIRQETENPPLERAFEYKMSVSLKTDITVGQNLAVMEKL
jgi:DNA polymerase I-like protein with 3'-5' exonuclease and polymerase domains